MRQQKNNENQFTFDEVTAKVKAAPFYG